MKSYEVNFDGLVGQTHNYAGLSSGNIASTKNALDKSYPKKAVKQGLDKMKYLRDLGIQQGVLAPQQRPDLTTLKKLGFSGSDAQIIEKAYKHPKTSNNDDLENEKAYKHPQTSNDDNL